MASAVSLEFSLRPTAELKPYAGNARVHPKAQVDEIVASIDATVFANPILLDEADVIIAGHGRLLAARQLALESVPTIRITGLTDAQKRVLRLADNRIAQHAAWDMDLVKSELELIELEGLDIEITGFTVAERDLMLVDEDPDDEVLPEMPSAALSQPGDIWLLGEHRLACGDVRDQDLMDRLMDGAFADAAFLDPPFNVRIDGHAGGKGKIRHREFAFASGEMSRPEFTGFLQETLGASARVSRSGAVHFVCMDHAHMDELLAAGALVYGKRLNMCVWKKSNAGMGGLYRSQHELVFVYRVGEAAHRNNVQLGKHGRNRTNVWEYASVNTVAGARRHELALHPTVKPVAMVADAIQDVTRPGEVVLDTFLGSGATLIAAERAGRRFRGLDVDPLYVDVAVRRWWDLTGREPVLEASGQTFSTVAAERGA